MTDDTKFTIGILLGLVGFIVFTFFLIFGVPWIEQAAKYNANHAQQYFERKK